MYAIYGNIYHQYTPVMLAYIPYDWILWECLNHFEAERDEKPWGLMVSQTMAKLVYT